MRTTRIQLGELWKYRVGDYRLICKIEDDRC
jgi:mRNA-degrading endonuclease RelE of RelBE toxin-antitoxin system